MASSASLSGTPEMCRMCMDDLSDVAEYYSIDGIVQELVLTLTGILVDESDNHFPTCMCSNCYDTLSQFNDTRNFWLENQQKFLKQADDCSEDADEASEIEEEGEEALEEETDTQFLVEDGENQFDVDHDADGFKVETDGFKVEYIEEVECEESDQAFVTDDSQILKSDENKRGTNRTKRPYTRKHSPMNDNKLKGKDLYQKLLKKCDECDKMIEKNRMEGHINKHRNIRPYTCEEDGCGKSFYCKLLFRLHRTSIHTGVTVDCDICHKTFPSDRSLYAHKLRHKNENRYNCIHCEKKFNNSNSLKRHLAVHSGIREYTCDFCTSSFYRKFNLDVHIKTVHNKDKSFFCGHCPKKFGYSRLLRDHIRKNHVVEITVNDVEEDDIQIEYTNVVES